MLTEKPTRRRRRTQNAICLIAAVFFVYYLVSAGRAPKDSSKYGTSQASFGGLHHQGPPHPPALLNNLSLTTAQCAASFPNLTWPISDVVSQGPFNLALKSAPVLLRIRDSHLTVLRAQPKSQLSAEMLNSRTASLHQIHRALLTAPSADPPLPDTVIALNFQDQPFGTAWSYSRQADPASRPGVNDGNPDARTFLMPHFSSWAWKLPFVGSVSRAAAAVARVEASLPSLRHKDPRAVWRGTAWFNSVQNPRLRGNLLAVARGQPWADVQPLEWEAGRAAAAGERAARNALPIEDFCRYRYVLHTEGVTYSGRFQFLQLCRSVVLTPPLAWAQHTAHLVKPVFSSALLGKNKDDDDDAGRSETVRRAWPVAYDGDAANMVFVAPDWSDLEETVAWLEAHPDVADGIAARQRGLFADGGYFSPAAEACYWRALIRGWSEVVRVDERELDAIGDGQTFEAFVLTNGQ